MITNIETENSTEFVQLAPDFRIPGGLLLIAGGFAIGSFWLGNLMLLISGSLAVFGLFLTVQTFLIRIQFSEQALNVLRLGKVIRSFPYSEWLNWEIFWSPVPILFYFREVNSIHFLPVIFNSKTLADCLHKHYPRKQN